MTARVPYCVAKGCNDLPPAEHLESHLLWACTGPEHMAGLLAAYDAMKRAEVLAEAVAVLSETDLPDDHIDMFLNGVDWAASLLRRLAAAPTTPAPKEK